MEMKVFPRPAVAAELSNYVEARLHTDGRKNIEDILELQKRLTQSVANPFYVAVDPKAEVILGKFDHATLSDDSPFVDFLKSSRASAKPAANRSDSF